MSNQQGSSGHSNKRLRESSRSRGSSWSQKTKDGEEPKQYIRAYESQMHWHALQMNIVTGKRLLSEESRDLCKLLQEVKDNSITPSMFPQNSIESVVQYYQNPNEAIVNRDITQMIVPPVLSLYLMGETGLGSVVDEVRTTWMSNCIIYGPAPIPDLAIGLLESSFTHTEFSRLQNYRSVDNWAKFTDFMYFPFLILEAKCGREALDAADRQNMHSCSIAVRAILRIVQEADKCRDTKRLEALNGNILTFSISHDQKQALVYGHFATIQDGKWEYYRHEIGAFRLNVSEHFIALHHFVRNVFKVFLPKHIRLIKDAVAVLPDPAAVISSSSTEEEINHDSQQSGSQQTDSRQRDSEQAESEQTPHTSIVVGEEAGFRVPDLPERVMFENLNRRLDAERQQREQKEQELERERQRHDAEIQQREQKERELKREKQRLEKMEKQIEELLQKVNGKA